MNSRLLASTYPRISKHTDTYENPQMHRSKLRRDSCLSRTKLGAPYYGAACYPHTCRQHISKAECTRVAATADPVGSQFYAATFYAFRSNDTQITAKSQVPCTSASGPQQLADRLRWSSFCFDLLTWTALSSTGQTWWGFRNNSHVRAWGHKLWVTKSFYASIL